MTQKGRVSPFGDPRIKGCSPLPAAFRSVPRPSSPLSAKASTKCPYALDPKPFRRTQRADPPCDSLQASTCNTQHSFYYPPGRQPRVPSASSSRPRHGNPCQQPVAFLSTMSKSRSPKTEVGSQRGSPSDPRSCPISCLPRNKRSAELLPANWWSRPGSNR
jgi:hypothetical protein